MRFLFFFLFFTFITVFFGYKSSPIIEPKNEKELGEKLFFDPVLSLDSTLSCASCHVPELAFADSVAISPGVGGVLGRRNAPSVMNIASREILFFDGRAANLEEQVHFPIEDPMEMNLKMGELVTRLKKNKNYNLWFRNIFSEEPNEKNIAKAIAAFEESLETDDSLFDQYMSGDKTKLSESAKRGRKLFIGEKAKCFDCHFGPDFTGDEFKNVGLYDEKRYFDKGRYETTKNPADIGKFKVPGLRNVAVTGPYMHDGSFKTLREVIDYYDDPYKVVKNPINIDTLLLKPLNLTEEEKVDLESFLNALTDSRFIHRIKTEK
ncbi:MAG: cytochrome-c peroxidase [Saprospiraceae bacterium]|nr:cytochrome-c peroxidase [Saprospiraceae bacterium]MBP6694794.1 cytochrome-c peroxidase [Saprospiraceae bacterium]